MKHLDAIVSRIFCTMNIKLGYIIRNSKSCTRHSIYDIKSDVFPTTSSETECSYYQKSISEIWMKCTAIHVTVKYRSEI